MLLLALASFLSMDDAAVAALTEARRCSQEKHVECGGVIFRRDGKFEYTAPITGKQQGIDLWPAYEPHQKDAVADYHVHLCTGVHEIAEVFSQQDMIVDAGFGIVGYMSCLCNDKVLRWSPGDPTDDFEVDYASGKQRFFGTGHVVGFVK